MDAHDQETQQQESRTSERTVLRNSEDRNLPITVVENQPNTAEQNVL